ncbi:MAG: cysteine--tRNA ligase, partial [Eubacterium sp.]|nr:cysteine--tRNA ligase [Eubacterium sp.]
DGTVYFKTRQFKDYGHLSNKNLDDMQAGIRIAVSDEKEDPMDFVLWKPKKEGEPSWPSPWGDGRPGWHIECSVMSKKYIGRTIDIHAGGEDLVFPHHENEIAQSEAANGEKFANYWMHNAFLNIDNKKMSKSAGNFFTVREISEKYPLQVIRFFMLSAHYRSPLNFSDTLVEASKNGLDRILTCVDNLKTLEVTAQDQPMTEAETANAEEIKKLVAKYEEAMEDDFNTADAISAIFEMVKLANVTAEGAGKAYISYVRETIEKLCDVLGIITEKEEELLDSDIEALIEERQQARKAKNFARADEIRNQLAEQGIILEDTRAGVKWKRA